MLLLRNTVGLLCCRLRSPHPLLVAVQGVFMPWMEVLQWVSRFYTWVMFVTVHWMSVTMFLGNELLDDGWRFFDWFQSKALTTPHSGCSICVLLLILYGTLVIYLGQIAWGVNSQSWHSHFCYQVLPIRDNHRAGEYAIIVLLAKRQGWLASHFVSSDSSVSSIRGTYEGLPDSSWAVHLHDGGTRYDYVQCPIVSSEHGHSPWCVADFSWHIAWLWIACVTYPLVFIVRVQCFIGCLILLSLLVSSSFESSSGCILVCTCSRLATFQRGSICRTSSIVAMGICCWDNFVQLACLRFSYTVTMCYSEVPLRTLLCFSVLANYYSAIWEMPLYWIILVCSRVDKNNVSVFLWAMVASLRLKCQYFKVKVFLEVGKFHVCIVIKEGTGSLQKGSNSGLHHQNTSLRIHTFYTPPTHQAITMLLYNVGLLTSSATFWQIITGHIFFRPVRGILALFYRPSSDAFISLDYLGCFGQGTQCHSTTRDNDLHYIMIVWDSAFAIMIKAEVIKGKSLGNYFAFHQLICNAVQNIFHNSYVRQQHMLTGRPLDDCAELFTKFLLALCPISMMLVFDPVEPTLPLVMAGCCCHCRRTVIPMKIRGHIQGAKYRSLDYTNHIRCLLRGPVLPQQLQVQIFWVTILLYLRRGEYSKILGMTLFLHQVPRSRVLQIIIANIRFLKWYVVPQIL